MQTTLPEVGLKAENIIVVVDEDTALSAGSGFLPVFSTPVLIKWMETTAAFSVQPFLSAGYSTVGTHLDVRHLAATPVGMRIRFETELIEVDSRRLLFACRAYDETELIGEGTHERFVVENESFLQKTTKKRSHAT